MKMLDSEQLQTIKLSVFKKVREELEYETKKTLIKSQQFEELVDMEVKNELNDLLEKERKEMNSATWEVTPISHK